jgi:hypothetical protein
VNSAQQTVNSSQPKLKPQEREMQKPGSMAPGKPYRINQSSAEGTELIYWLFSIAVKSLSPPQALKIFLSN